MNTTAILALAAAFALATPALRAQTANDMVRIEVRVGTDNEKKDIKGATADTVTQNKTLQIAISGKPKSPETRTGKWTMYGRSLKGHDTTVLGSGEFKIEIPATGQQKIESTKVSTTYTPEHTVGSGSSGRSRTSNAKKVPAEGTKYAGYGVVVKDGGKVVGEIFDPMGLKQEAAK